MAMGYSKGHTLAAVGSPKIIVPGRTLCRKWERTFSLASDMHSFLCGLLHLEKARWPSSKTHYVDR